MRLLEIRETTSPIGSSIRNAYIDFGRMTTSLVAVITDVVRDGQRVVGYGFNSNGRYGQGGLIRERFAPRLLEAAPESLLDASGENLDPDRVWSTPDAQREAGRSRRALRRRGDDRHGDLGRGGQDRGPAPLPPPGRASRAARPTRASFVYAAGGYYAPDKGLEVLRAEMRGYVDRGYTVVKMKIGGASLDEDQRRIEAVLSEIEGRARLAVDANGRFDLPTAIAYARMLRAYPLFWFEEAGDPLDFALQAALAAEYPGPMATGENLFSHQDARNLLRYAGLRPDRDWLQFDCALSYGLCEYQRTLAVIDEEGWSRTRCIPHGGHQMSLHIAAGLGLGGNEDYPDLFQPFGGFPDGVRVQDGYVTLPERPGLGFEGKAELIRRMRALAE